MTKDQNALVASIARALNKWKRVLSDLNVRVQKVLEPSPQSGVWRFSGVSDDRDLGRTRTV